MRLFAGAAAAPSPATLFIIIIIVVLIINAAGYFSVCLLSTAPRISKSTAGLPPLAYHSRRRNSGDALLFHSSVIDDANAERP